MGAVFVSTLQPPATLNSVSLVLGIRQAVYDDRPDEVRVAGDWGPQTLRNLSAGYPLTIDCADAELGNLRLEGACADLTIRDARVTADSGTALKLIATPTGASRRIVFDHVAIDATGAARAVSLERLVPTDGVEDPDRWHTDITFVDGDWHGSIGDLTAIYGARNVILARNSIHDATIPPATTDHIDGVQVTHCVPYDKGVVAGYRWPVGLLVEENDIYNRAVPAVWGGPHTGVVITSGTTGLVDGVVIRGNRVGAPGGCWPGGGIGIEGAETTHVRCYGNTIGPSAGGCVVNCPDDAWIDHYACPWTPGGGA